MALEKKVTYDYEVRGEYKCIQQRARTAVVEDGEEISFSYHRISFMPDADVSGESDEVKALADSKREYSLSDLEREKARYDSDMAEAKAESDELGKMIADFKKL